MHSRQSVPERLLETILVFLTTALVFGVYFSAETRIALLNLFFLPVVLAGFFLGRNRAGLLALLSVVLVAMVTASGRSSPDAISSPAVAAATVTLWGAVLGLTALLVGTLSDQLTAKMIEPKLLPEVVESPVPDQPLRFHPTMEDALEEVVSMLEPTVGHRR